MAIPVLAPTQVSNSELQMSSISSSASVDGAALKISGEVMVGAVIFLFMVLVFVIFLYLYARRHLGATFGLSGASNSHRRHIFVPANATPRRRGLDESVLHSLPIATFCSSDDDNFKDGLECAVCLSDISDGEKFRLLPKCNHGFHVECIDMWFFSNSTCPLCRSSVGCPQHDMLLLPQPNAVLSTPPATHTEAEAEAEADVSPAEFPTNVLICGTRNQVESSSSISPLRPEGMLVIDIPRRAMEEFSFSSPVSPFTSKSPVSDMKSPASAKFKAFRRLMSFGKRSAAAGPSTSWSSPREGGGGDVELGQGVIQTATTTPRTPPPPPPMCS